MKSYTDRKKTGTQMTKSLRLFGSDHEALVKALLARASEPVTLIVITGVTSADLNAAASRAPILALEKPAIEVIGAALAEDASPAEAVSEWVVSAERRLKAMRRMRKSLMLADVAALEQHDPEVEDWIGDSIGVQFSPIEAAPVAAQRVDPLYLVLAQTLIDADPAVQAVHDELDAMRAPMAAGPAAATANVDTALKTLRDLRSEAARSAELDALADRLDSIVRERDAIQTQLSRSLSFAEQATAAQQVADAAEAKLEAVTGELGELRDLVQQQDQTKGNDAELELLRESLTLLLAQIDGYTTVLDEKEAENAELHAVAAARYVLKSECFSLRKQLTDAETMRRRREAVLGAALLQEAKRSREALSELERIYASRSWKAVSKMRKARHMVGG